MEYMLMIYSDPEGWAQLTPAQAAEGMAAYGAYHEALQKAGVLKCSSRLRPGNTATTVRLKSGKSQVLDGPFIETQRAARRLLPDRGARSRRGAVLGGALPRRRARRDRSASGLGDG